MKPYYQDEHVTLYHGDSLEILPTLEIQANVLLTDPPYFKVKQEEWDNQWDKAHEFLEWMGEFLDRTKPLLTANASVWVFASPAMTSSVERLIGERFRVLNSIRWVKQGSMAHRQSLQSLRTFTSFWEGIVFAEQFHDMYGDAAKALHREVFAPIGRYVQQEWERAGWKAGKLGKALGYDSALPTRWAEGSSLPTQDTYERMRHLLNSKGGEYLRREYEDLRREYEDLRRPFRVESRKLMGDIWDFASTPAAPGRHPCEKPISLIRHMVEASSRPGDLILDPFAGSGSTLDAARQSGRRAIGIEKDERWCEYIAKRLAQEVFDFGYCA